MGGLAMAMEDFNRHQQGIIKGYYAHAGALGLQRLAELVTELYLAEGPKKQKLWDRAGQALEKLAVPASRIKTLLDGQDPARLAELVGELQAK